MRWFNWFRRDEANGEDDAPLDLDLPVTEGLRDPAVARSALAQLRGHRKRLLRQQRSVDKQFKRPSTVNIRNMGRSGPQMGAYQLSQSLQDMNNASLDSARAEQEADIERRLKSTEEAIAQLKSAARQ